MINGYHGAEALCSHAPRPADLPEQPFQIARGSSSILVPRKGVLLPFEFPANAPSGDGQAHASRFPVDTGIALAQPQRLQRVVVWRIDESSDALSNQVGLGQPPAPSRPLFCSYHGCAGEGMLVAGSAKVEIRGAPDPVPSFIALGL